MQADLADHFDAVRETYADASEILAYDLWALVKDGPAEKLSETRITQPAMLTAGVAAFRCWQAAGGGEVTQMAGHSLGEYSALVCAGAMSFADAVTVVKRRSELMQEAVPVGAGAMAAILGLDDDVVIDVCARAAGEQVAEAVNFNSPGQVVIAGDKDAINRAMELAQEAGARRTLQLPVSVPAHSALMRDAGVALLDTLNAADISAPGVTVISASDATPYSDGDDIRTRLSRQVYSPVQWVQTTKAMIDAGATRIIECGPGKVLAGLTRRINKATPATFIDSYDGLQKAKDSV
jgi:[acyl-carrier-protein] S-malonyltransferase